MPASETNPVAYSVTTGGAFDYARPMTQLDEESVGEIVWQPETDPAPESGAATEYAAG